MARISIRRFGLAFGATSALFYLGCVIVTLTVSREMAIQFFNTILHGIDVTSVIRMNMPTWEAVIGIIEAFILGWLLGATVATVYNFGLSQKAATS